MALAQEDIEQIQKLIRQSIAATPEVTNANVRYELDLRERTIRVEEELKHQRELMLSGFSQMEKRFEQVDKRIDQVDKRIDQVDKKIDQVETQIGQVDKKIDQVEARIGQVEKHFEQVEKRFEKIDHQFDKQSRAIMGIHQEIKQQMRWSFGVLLTIGGLVVAVLKFIN